MAEAVLFLGELENQVKPAVALHADTTASVLDAPGRDRSSKNSRK